MDYQCDIIVEHKVKGLKYISDLLPSFMTMQYLILFPYDEDGFKINIKLKISQINILCLDSMLPWKKFMLMEYNKELEKGKHWYCWEKRLIMMSGTGRGTFKII